MIFADHDRQLKERLSESSHDAHHGHGAHCSSATGHGAGSQTTPLDSLQQREASELMEEALLAKVHMPPPKHDQQS